MKRRVFINHGYGASPDNHWFPWLKKELEIHSFEVFLPQMPNPQSPNRDQWINTIRECIKNPDKNTYFVGHSLGALSIAYYLQSLDDKTLIGGCVFVGGFSGDIGKKEIQDFVSKPLDFEKVKSHTEKLVTVVSRTDDRVPLDKAIEFQKNLSAELILEQNMGHFREQDGVIYLEVVLQNILKMAGI